MVVYDKFITIVHKGYLKIHVIGTQKIWSHPLNDIIDTIVYNGRFYVWDHCPVSSIKEGKYCTDELTIYDDHNEHCEEAARQSSPEILLRLVRHLNVWQLEYDCRLVDYGVTDHAPKRIWPTFAIDGGFFDCSIVCNDIIEYYEN